MKVLGLKLTHDGGIALLDGTRLVFSVEMEKVANRHRHAEIDDVGTIASVLADQGVALDDVEAIAVDGWHAAPGQDHTTVRLGHGPGGIDVAVAPYHEDRAGADPLRAYTAAAPWSGHEARPYASYHHATDHMLSGYCTSPFARDGAPAYVLVWDGGMLPLLYHIEPANPRLDPASASLAVRSMGPLFPIYGNAFAEFAGQCEEYRAQYEREQREAGRTRPSAIAGKAMAYAGLGRAEEDTYPVFERLLDRDDAFSIEGGVVLGRETRRRRDELFPSLTDADLIASFQAYLGGELVDSLKRVLAREGGGCHNLVFVGGCALNIKWNSTLRGSGLFDAMWVPPFPNDAGSAIGAAMTHHVVGGGDPVVEWSVYAGPSPGPVRDLPWRRRTCDAAGLAELLAEVGEPVVVVDGLAELGPRALGNRSILAPCTDPRMRDRLNKMKGREHYRPVAPICLVEDALGVFDPGTPDPYMLFDHRVRAEWAGRIPAVVHHDGTARLQTVGPGNGSRVGEVLREYRDRTGIPVLCNTSANHAGRGFFPDAGSAIEWGQCDYVWSSGTLYIAPGAADPAGEARR
ncbi:carbamoyltransferase N-terminal domain-containing protein [Actinomadura sp. 7K507]|uniref:carbamoyltransferase N-terminal domain-containing protein n=1 Tax=Actinomadura sp. 7K507 TaxID=2530365 RepID=UPI0010530F58|nr:carbamoyltransferase N-terminal domain-containing protein [Actinomadura sp. 7K507]TDC86436.1 hypothetical protein E1285_23325 [Actinomadura sp. 7K507]